MPFVRFDFRNDFEEVSKKGLSPAQFQFLKELFFKHQLDEDKLYTAR